MSVRPAFTLVELLVVMAVILVLIALAVPAFNSIKGGSDLTKSAYDIGGLLDQARAYATANNTHVYVGFMEVDQSAPGGTAKVVPGTGRVLVAVVASKDGTRGYDVNSPTDWTRGYNTSVVGNLLSINKLAQFDNLHLADFGKPPLSGNMARPAYPIGGIPQCLGAADCVSLTPIEWPLGAQIGSGKYSFAKVINYDSQGVARIQSADSSDSIVSCIEIDLQPTRGSAVPAAPSNQNTGELAALQINAVTGATHIYRP